MGGLPTGCMTRLTVTAGRKGLANRITYKSTSAGVMAVGAICNMRRGRNKCIRMTRCTVISSCCRYKTAVVNNMDRIPARAVTVRTVAAR